MLFRGCGRTRRRTATLGLLLGLFGLAGVVPVAFPRAEVAVEPTIRRLEFVGNRFFAARELDRWMRQHPASALRSTRYHPAELLQDLERLRRLYLGEGFLAMRIDARVDSSLWSEGSVDVQVSIEEGERWQLLTREIELIGPESTPDLADSLFRRLELKAPGPYRLRAVVTDRERIVRALAERGLLEARVEVLAAREDSCRSARLRFRVQTGPRARVTDVQIRGRVRTHPELIRRELAFHEGEVLLPAALSETRAGLLRTGLFREVRVEASERDSGRAEKTVIITVRETPAGTLGGGCGYGTSDHARLAAALEHRNLAGRGVRAALRGVYGERRRGGEAELNLPRTFGSRIATAWSAHHERLSSRSYEAERSGGAVRFVRSWRSNRKIDLGYSVDRLHLLKGGRRADDERPQRLGRLAAGVTQDSRDDLFLPGRGLYLRLQSEWNSPLFGSRARFVRTDAEQRWHVPLGRGVISARLRQGWISEEESRPAPITERYLAGGLMTLRGFPEEGVGPLDSLGVVIGGIWQLLASAELRVPITSGLSASVFCDAGQPAVDHRHFRWDAASIGAGVGIQLRVPVGRLKCAVAWPVTSRHAECAQYYLGSGSAF